MSLVDWQQTRQRLIEVPEPPSPKRLIKRGKLACKALECRLCFARFTVNDILIGNYNLETFICSFCYEDMQKKPHALSCFGKPTTILENGKRLYGYEPDAIECSKRCPDRVLCQRIVRPDLQIVADVEDV